MEEKTEEAQRWNVGTDPGREIETELGMKRVTGARISCRSPPCSLYSSKARVFFVLFCFLMSKTAFGLFIRLKLIPLNLAYLR